MKFKTESGTTYEVDGLRVRRVTTGDSATMRRDEEWLNMQAEPRIEVGKPVIFLLEPLGLGNVTIRTTTCVTRVY